MNKSARSRSTKPENSTVTARSSSKAASASQKNSSPKGQKQKVASSSKAGIVLNQSSNQDDSLSDADMEQSAVASQPKAAVSRSRSTKKAGAAPPKSTSKKIQSGQAPTEVLLVEPASADAKRRGRPPAKAKASQSSTSISQSQDAPKARGRPSSKVAGVPRSASPSPLVSPVTTGKGKPNSRSKAASKEVAVKPRTTSTPSGKDAKKEKAGKNTTPTLKRKAPTASSSSSLATAYQSRVTEEVEHVAEQSKAEQEKNLQKAKATRGRPSTKARAAPSSSVLVEASIQADKGGQKGGKGRGRAGPKVESHSVSAAPTGSSASSSVANTVSTEATPGSKRKLFNISDAYPLEGSPLKLAKKEEPKPKRGAKSRANKTTTEASASATTAPAGAGSRARGRKRKAEEEETTATKALSVTFAASIETHASQSPEKDDADEDSEPPTKRAAGRGRPKAGTAREVRSPQVKKARSRAQKEPKEETAKLEVEAEAEAEASEVEAPVPDAIPSDSTLKAEQKMDRSEVDEQKEQLKQPLQDAQEVAAPASDAEPPQNKGQSERESPTKPEGKVDESSKPNVPEVASQSNNLAILSQPAAVQSAPKPTRTDKRKGAQKTPAHAPELANEKHAPEAAPVPPTTLVPIATLPATGGEALCVGSNDAGQLGLPTESVKDRKRPQPPRNIHDPLAQLVAGGMHSVALTMDGRVLSWGSNDEGALGRDTHDTHEDDKDEDQDEEEEKATAEDMPGEVTFPKKERIVQLAAGNSHTAAITEDGRLYLWGKFRNLNDKLHLISRLPLETKVSDLDTQRGERIARISSGAEHLVLLSNWGRVFTCGACDAGQLGRIPEKETPSPENLLRPQLVSLPQVDGKATSVDRVWATEDNTFLRVLSGTLLGFGPNNLCQLGLPDRQHRFTPTVLPAITKAVSAAHENEPDADNVRIVEIAGGTHHILFLDSTGLVYALGRHDYGRLGLGDPNPAPPPKQAVNQLKNGAADHEPQGQPNGDANPEQPLEHEPNTNATLMPNGAHANGENHLVDGPEGGQAAAPAQTYQAMGEFDAQAPRPILSLRTAQVRICHIAASQAVSFAIDSNGQAYSWGTGFTEPVQEEEAHYTWTPTRVEGKNLENRRVLEITTGGSHATFLLSPKENAATTAANGGTPLAS